MAAFNIQYAVMNNEKLGAAPQMYAGGDAKQAIEFAWPYAAYFEVPVADTCYTY